MERLVVAVALPVEAGAKLLAQRVLLVAGLLGATTAEVRPAVVDDWFLQKHFLRLSLLTIEYSQKNALCATTRN